MKNLPVLLGASFVATAAFACAAPAHAGASGERVGAGSVRSNGLHLNALTYIGAGAHGLAAPAGAGTLGSPSSNLPASVLPDLAQTALLKQATLPGKAAMQSGGLSTQAAHVIR